MEKEKEKQTKIKWNEQQLSKQNAGLLAKLKEKLGNPAGKEPKTPGQFHKP